MLVIGVAIMLLALAALAFAARIGEKPERWGAGVIFVGAVATQLVQANLGNEPPIWAVCLVDTIQGLALLAITIRSGRLWAGIAACAQSLVVVLTAVKYFSFPLSGTPYLVALNLSGWVPILALLGGAIAVRWGPNSESEDELGEPAWSH